MHRIADWLRQAEAWLDGKGKMAWIATMVLGFIFVWPIGLAILFYMIWSGRMGCGKHSLKRSYGRSGAGTTGNAAFDEYPKKPFAGWKKSKARLWAFSNNCAGQRTRLNSISSCPNASALLMTAPPRPDC